MAMVGMINTFNSMLWQDTGTAKKYDTSKKTIDLDSAPKGKAQVDIPYYPVQWGLNVDYTSFTSKTDTNYSYTFNDSGTVRTVDGNTVRSKKSVDRTSIDLYGNWQFSNLLNLRLFSNTDIDLVREEQTITQNSWNSGAVVPGMPKTYSQDYRTISTGLGMEGYGVKRTGQRYGYGTLNGFSYLGGFELRGYQEYLSPQYSSDQYKISQSDSDRSNFGGSISGMVLGDFSPGDMSKYFRFTTLAGGNVSWNTHSDVVTSSSKSEIDPGTGIAVPTGTEYTWAGKYYTSNYTLFGEASMLMKYEGMYLKTGYRPSYRSNNFMASDGEMRNERIFEQYFPVEAGYIIQSLNTKVSGEVVFKTPAVVSGEDRGAVEEGIYGNPVDSVTIKASWKADDWDISLRGGIKNGGVPGYVKTGNSETSSYSDSWQPFVGITVVRRLNWGQ